jgi:outer membrane protein assembly factor BamB
LVTESRVYIGTHDGRFFALDRVGDGAPIWSYRTGGWVRSTANWVDGLVIFGSDDGFLYAFDERP